ncbi:asparagine synthetase B family protein [Rhizobium leguminosarum]|uniref:asparagine synthase (glutamine-hydrolyzing) n=3 Tax=Rhizobium leguminosarum TaxID=384 RepID=A0A0U3IHQ8_RHILV|nr:MULTISPECIES: asparagine synthase-related protein [Rhizobium]ALU64552.1 Asparagine synthetase [glutamine-hydrolyzing] [Rhizobium leguminosarum bv. viciae]KZB02845.1 hypothetical protein A4A59_08225 [Rhizobium leguminosarum]NKM21962.1 asparagine synthase [Rhizobium laguerreae]
MAAIYGLFGVKREAVLLKMERLLDHHGREKAREILASGGLGSVGQDPGGCGRHGQVVAAIAGMPFRLTRGGTIAAVGAGELARAFSDLGFEALADLDGQFAVAIWDGMSERLYLARDAFGTIPLYFSCGAEFSIFASEYKALLAYEAVPAQPDRVSISSFCSRGWVPAGRTFFGGIKPVLPGTCMVLKGGTLEAHRFYPQAAIDNPPIVPVSPGALVSEIETGVERIIALAGDRRVGMSLSGGIDSAFMATLVSRHLGHRKLHSFTVGFGKGDPEMEGARETAEFLNSAHHELVIEPADLPALLDTTVDAMEDPGGYDQSCSLFSLWKEARNHVDVLVSGNISDSLFAGMASHRRIWRANAFPTLWPWLREVERAEAEGGTPRGFWRLVWQFLGKRSEPFPCGAEIDLSSLPPDLWRTSSRRQTLYEHLDLTLQHWDGRMGSQVLIAAHSGILLAMPFSHRGIVEFALRVPDSQKVSRKRDKIILREAANQVLPTAVASRQKRVQQLRYDETFADTLNFLVDRYLHPKDVAARGLLDPAKITDIHQGGKSVYSKLEVQKLWNAICTEVWARNFLDRRSDYLSTDPNVPERGVVS